MGIQTPPNWANVEGNLIWRSPKEFARLGKLLALRPMKIGLFSSAQIVAETEQTRQAGRAASS
jgi:hypothetical protein